MSVKIKIRNWHRNPDDSWQHMVITVPQGTAIAVKEGVLRVMNVKGEMIYSTNNLSWRTAEVVEQTGDVTYEYMNGDQADAGLLAAS